MPKRNKTTGRFEKGSNRKLINDFSKITPESSYWLGFLFGDGSIDSADKLQLCLSSVDHSHTQKLSQFLFGVDYTNYYPQHTKSHMQITSHCLAQQLKKYNIIPDKTYKSNMILPNRHKKDFLRGFFDADGWISIGKSWNTQYNKHYDRHCFGVCSYLKTNIETFNSYMPHPGNINKKRNQELYELRWGSKPQIIDLAKYLQGFPRLDRKWIKLDKLING